MLSQRQVTLTFLLLLCPSLVVPQTYFKVIACTLCSGVFIAAGCPPEENLMCRIMAFKLNVLNCRTFPCINYDAPVQNKCEDFPLGCPVQHLKIFGLCEPMKICCGTGGEEAQSSFIDFLKSGNKRGIIKSKLEKSLSRLSTLARYQDGLKSKGREEVVAASPFLGQLPNVTSNDGDDNKGHGESNQGFQMASTPEEYMKDWPANQDDPTIVEKTIKDQYVKMLQELDAITQQEMENGMDSYRIPDFEEFRSAALGEIPLQ